MALFELNFGNSGLKVTGIEPVSTGQKAAVVDFANGNWAFVSTNLQGGGKDLWSQNANGTYSETFLTDEGFLNDTVELTTIDGDQWIVRAGRRNKMQR